MRFLKRQTLDRRTANNTTLYSDASRANVYVSPVGQGSLVLPNGPTSAQPASPSTGMMRYDTTTNQVMVYQGTAWRALRFKESTQITQQNLGLQRDIDSGEQAKSAVTSAARWQAASSVMSGITSGISTYNATGGSASRNGMQLGFK